MRYERKNYQVNEKEYSLMKMTNNTVKLGYLCAIGVGIIALCSKINVNVNVAGGDLDKIGLMKERKRIVNNLREKSYSDEEIADLLGVSLDDVKSISE